MSSFQEQFKQRVNVKVIELRKALEQLAAIRGKLESEASEAKSDISSGVSRQTELLRSREIWLLSQVDVIYHAKDATLLQQATKLSHALGVLRGYLECSGDLLNMNGLLDRMESLELEPCETPFISYRANSSDLHGAIHRFGKVDSHFWPPDSVFYRGGGEGDNSAPCLPRHFEEYGDDESQILHKTLADIECTGKTTDFGLDEFCQSNAATPSVSIPAWLMLTKGLKSGSESKTSGKSSGDFLFPGQVPASVEHWLKQIRSQPEVEDDMMDANSSGATFEKSSGFTGNLDLATMKYFRDVVASLPDGWLLKSGEKASKASYEPLKFMEEQSKNMTDWLLAKCQNEKTNYCSGRCENSTKVPDLEDIDCLHVSSTCHRDSSASITNISPRCEALEASYFRALSSDLDYWLWKKSDSDQRVPWHPAFSSCSGSGSVACIANEPCESLEECLADKKCQVDDNKMWLLKCNGKKDIQGFNRWPYFEKVFADSASDWLSKGEKSGYNGNSLKHFAAIFSPFSQGSDDYNRSWLMSDNKQRCDDDTENVDLGLVQNFGNLFHPNLAQSKCGLDRSSSFDSFEGDYKVGEMIKKWLSCGDTFALNSGFSLGNGKVGELPEYGDDAEWLLGAKEGIEKYKIVDAPQMHHEGKDWCVVEGKLGEGSEELYACFKAPFSQEEWLLPVAN